ncbi:MAG: hypothetical protein K0Q67_478 [Cellvibrio sp.]|jgi:hypothetical protein|nr:hypothetical protein [Cellvibrio sp.]
MSSSLVLQQYWQLIRALWLPLWFIRWLAAAEFGLLTIGGLLLWWSGQPVVLMIAVGIGLVLIMTVGILVPGQVLALVSSKQLCWMPGLRMKIFTLLLCFCALLAFAGSGWLVTMKPESRDFTTLFSVAFLFLSFVSMVMVIAGAYLGFLQVLIAAFVWVASIVAEHLLHIELLVSWCLIIIIWTGFYLWWRQWQPRKYLVNYMTLSQVKIKELHEQQSGLMQSLSYSLSSPPGSLAGTLLLTTSDGSATLIKREFGYFLLIALTAVLTFFFTRQVPQEFLHHTALVLMIVYFLSRGFQLQMYYYRNLYRVWLIFGGTRAKIFNYIEKQFAAHMAVIFFPAMTAAVLLNHLLGDAGINVVVLLFAGLISVLLLAQLFYVSLIIYIKSTASIVWLNWLVAVLTIFFMLLMAYFDLLLGTNVRQASGDYWLFCAILALMVLAMRGWVLQCWRHINFIKVKS